MLRKWGKRLFFRNMSCLVQFRGFGTTELKRRRHPPGHGATWIYEGKRSSTLKRKKQRKSFLLSTSLGSPSTPLPSSTSGSFSPTPKEATESHVDVAITLLHERAKWFGHVIPGVSLVVLDTLRSDVVPGHPLPEKGNLLVLDSWEEFTQRSSTPSKEQQLFATQDTVQIVVNAIRAFLAQQEEHDCVATPEKIAKLPLLILIPSRLDSVAATREQLLLEQAMLMDEEFKALGLHRATAVWVMSSEESWRWREALLDGTVSVTWPLRTPQHVSAIPRRLLELPPIPDENLHHIMPKVDLHDINAVFSSSPNVVLPRVGHLLILRDVASSHCPSGSNVLESSLPTTRDDTTPTSSTPVEKVTALMPVIEKAMKDYIAGVGGRTHNSQDHPLNDEVKHSEDVPLTVLVFSFLGFSEAQDFQRLLHCSLLMTSAMQKKHFRCDPVVWVLTGEQKEKLTRAYHSKRVGKGWASVVLPKQNLLGDPLSSLPRTTTHERAASLSQLIIANRGKTIASLGKEEEKVDAQRCGDLATAKLSFSSSSGAASPAASPLINAEEESVRKTSLPWGPPENVLVGEDGEPVPILSSELRSHGEIETLWSSAPGFSVHVESLQPLLPQKVFVKLQNALQRSFWQPPRLHVLACHAGDEQLEQNTAMMFTNLMKTAADYFELLTGENTLQSALEGNSPPYEMDLGEGTSLDDVEELENMKEGNRRRKASASFISASSFSSCTSTATAIKQGGIDREEKLCSGRFAKIIILLYTDLLVPSEVDLLRVLLRNLYYQLPESAQNIIIELEVMDDDARAAGKTLEQLKFSNSGMDSPSVQKRKDKIGSIHPSPREGDSASVPNAGLGEATPDEKSAPLSPETLKEALNARAQFLKLLQQRESLIRAEVRKTHQQHNQEAQEQRTQKLLPSSISSSEDSGDMLTSKSELKNMLEDAVEEVTVRHEQAMSRLVDAMSKMVGAWTSESFLQELSTTIKESIEPLQEHLSESVAASAKCRRGIIMSEDVGREILQKLDILLDIFSPTFSTSKSEVSEKLETKQGAADVSECSHSNSNSRKPLSVEGPETEDDKNLNGIPKQEIAVQLTHASTPIEAIPDKCSVTVPQSSLKISVSEVRFLNRVAKKLRRQRKMKGSKAAANAWLSATKHVVPNHPEHCYHVVLPSSFLIKNGGNADSVLHGIVVQLIESAYLLGKPRLRRRLKKSRTRHRSRLLSVSSNKKKTVRNSSRSTHRISGTTSNASSTLSPVKRILIGFHRGRKSTSSKPVPLVVPIRKRKSNHFRLYPHRLRYQKKQETCLSRMAVKKAAKKKK